MAGPTRTHRFNLMLSTEEVGWLREMSKQFGVSGADIVRQLIRREHRDRIDNPTAPRDRNRR